MGRKPLVLQEVMKVLQINSGLPFLCCLVAERRQRDPKLRRLTGRQKRAAPQRASNGALSGACEA